MSLTPRQELFAQEYVKTGSQSEAYRLSYSSKNMLPATVNNNAYKLLQNNEIVTRVNQIKKELEKRHNIDIDWCIEKLKLIVEDDETDRVSAVDKLMKHLGAYDADNRQKNNEIIISFKD